MLDQGLSFLKSLIKSSLDNYVLPGTCTGTEIMLVYMSQWRRDLVLVVIAALYIMSAQIDRSRLTLTPSKSSIDSTSSK